MTRRLFGLSIVRYGKIPFHFRKRFSGINDGFWFKGFEHCHISARKRSLFALTANLTDGDDRLFFNGVRTITKLKGLNQFIAGITKSRLFCK